MASEFVLPVLLSIRRMSVQPDGALIVVLEGCTAMEAIMTSFVVVPLGLLIVIEGVDGRSARICVAPVSASPAAVAFLAPEPPATGWST
jgi:hypothetical protein